MSLEFYLRVRLYVRVVEATRSYCFVTQHNSTIITERTTRITNHTQSQIPRHNSHRFSLVTKYFMTGQHQSFIITFSALLFWLWMVDSVKL